VRCAACEFESAPNARYCAQCGKPLATRCTSCGSLNPAQFRYCGQCGTALDQGNSALSGPAQTAIVATPQQPTTGKAEAERRQLTIMFCDLVESTAWSARLDAEVLSELILDYRQLCVAEIERVEGFVARLVGDGLLVYFGYPRAHDDDAVRAVTAALAIVSSVTRFSDRMESRLGSKLQVHIGIHTGEVVAGELGTGAAREQSAIVGEAPNVAHSLEQAAGPGAILISRITRDLVDHVFDCEALGELAVKGIPQPVGLFRVIGERRGSRDSGIFQVRSRAPLLGRTEELAFLSKQWANVQEGRGQVQLLSGEAGIGKSRLLHALATQLSAQGCEPLGCQCVPHFSNTALYPFVDLLQRVLDLKADQSIATKVAKLKAAFDSGQLPEPAALPLLASLMSLPVPGSVPAPEFSPRVQREKVMECLLGWLAGQASRKPLVLMVEDIHWADASTIELLTLLVDQLGSIPIFLLTTCRPEFAVPWSSHSVVSRMTLARLSATQCREMIEYLVQGHELSPELREQVVSRTDGVPLFVEELTKMVVEAGVLAQQQAVDTLPTGSIPTTLRGSLVARLDRLGNAKGLAQLAAVIGREFSYKVIHAVAQQDERELKELLARLVEAELVYQRGFPPNALYSFKHALIQDAAYQSLLKTKRAEYHRQVATALVESFPDVMDSHPELVAQHYEEAGMIDEAVTYWQKAGARALDASADDEAVAHLRRALAQIAVLPPSRDKVARETACLLSLGAALTAIRGYASTEVAQTYERAISLCEHSGDTDRLFTALTGLTSFYQVRGPLITARRISERLLELAQKRDDNIWLAQAHRRLGWCLFCQGQLKPGREHLERALRLNDRLRSHEHTRVYGAHPWAIGLVNIALLEWFAGFPDDAVIRAREGLSHARELGRPLTLAYALCMSAAVHQCRGDIDATKQLAQEVVALSKEHDYPYWNAWGSVLEGWALAAGGELEEGESRMHSGLAMYRDTGALLFEPWSLALVAEVYWRAGRLEEALDSTSRALDSPEMLHGYFYGADIHRLKGELLLARHDDVSQAEGCFLHALKIAREQGARSLELRCAVSLGELRKRQGHADECRRLVQDVLDGFDQGLDTADLTRAMKLLSAA
jgi:class 3 adenylate cyclase/tetratricopeptide (TPR) repeat protein